MLAPGRLLNDRYEIGPLIGEGGVGVVYRAHDGWHARSVAIKQFRSLPLDFQEQLPAHAERLNHLHHPGLAQSIAFFSEDGETFQVMEYVPGDDLAVQSARRGEPFSARQVVGWAAELLDLLSYLHDQEPPIIHRDIKPHNIKLSAAGHPMLLDLGFYVHDAFLGHTSYTPAYAAPEQIASGTADCRSDLYSLGATLYDLVTGVKPPDALTRLNDVGAGKPDPVAPADLWNPEVSPALAAVLQRALVLDPLKRYANADEFLSGLQRCPEWHVREGEHGREPTPNNLPERHEGFIGRAELLLQVRTALHAPASRLITLTGTGGIGKTSAAIGAARQVLDRWPVGVFLVSLDATSSVEQVPSAIFHVLAGRIPGMDSSAQEVETLIGDQYLLLLLDNLEHLTGIADYVSHLLVQCRNLKILATSREPLGIDQEHEISVPPLSTPRSGQLLTLATAHEYAAVAFFCLCAQQSAPGFAISADNLAAIVQICVRLDGLPLAIELAASHMSTMTPQTLLAQLDNRFELLQRVSPSSEMRRQTLRATIDWSYGLLREAERTLLCQLTVFPGAFSVQAAATICSSGKGNVGATTQGEEDGALLDALHRKNLIRLADDTESSPRFALLESIRQYAQEFLLIDGDWEQMQARHAAYFGLLAAETRPPTEREAVWSERIEQEYVNYLAALAFSVASAATVQAFTIVCTLWPFWELRSMYREGLTWLERVLPLLDEKTPAELAAELFRGAGHLSMDISEYANADLYLREYFRLAQQTGALTTVADAVGSMGILAYYRRDYDAAERHFLESMTIREQLGEYGAIARSLNNLAVIAHEQGNSELAGVYQERSLHYFLEVGDTVNACYTLLNLGTQAEFRQELDRALELYSRSLELAQQLGNEWAVAACLNNLGSTMARLGDYEEAIALLSEAVDGAWAIGDKAVLAEALDSLTRALVGQEECKTAVYVGASAAALRDAINHPRPVREQTEFEQAVGVAQATMDPEAFKLAWNRGAAAPLREIVVQFGRGAPA